MKITAVIPIRIGSQRVKNKNLKPFGDTNLLELKIDNLKQVKGIHEIIVNTDSLQAIEIAKQKGVAFHKREDYYASSQCTNSEFLQHLGLVTETDIFAYCPCTTPFIKSTTIQEAIDSFLKSDEHDCLATVSLMKEFLWLDDNPINYERDKQPNSQNLPNIYALNFGLNLISRQDLIQYKNIVGMKPMFKIIDEIEGLDIDTPLDFFVAQQIYTNRFEFKID
ncbi:acylneuraminate cytidylyltransferase family protein [Runella slithyformis]|uniref:Acylneuraminate cytidylyltransferase n=1 Tax=Runella slithyformis (strain ATCC 29530 / DSM 19594 / LMG 11500 / NCIMB 11436 / LSU 4) TaxID=761193 RepID=A0A7U3ZPK9_RUNSL|nr:NTP transferase domain-containing protein [Runella slithyformis]AEI51020.1 acylneuraminate cytidylyltransferase [Runella slithyformis DSM 19594]